MPKLISWAGEKIENKPVGYDFFYTLTMDNEQRKNMVTRDPGNQEVLSKIGNTKVPAKGGGTKHTTSNIITDKPYTIMGPKISLLQS